MTEEDRSALKGNPQLLPSGKTPLTQRGPPEKTVPESKETFVQAKLLSYKNQIALANERLIDSVTKVTELLRANQHLREEVDYLSRNLDSKDHEVFTTNQENIKLRERIEILETFLKTTPSTINDQQTTIMQRTENSFVSKIGLNSSRRDNITTVYSNDQNLSSNMELIEPSNQSIDKVYRELITLRQNNRVLETRVKTLEKQNIEISKSLEFVGNNEPARPLMIQQPIFSERDDEDGQRQSLTHVKKKVRYSEDHSLQFSPSEDNLTTSYFNRKSGGERNESQIAPETQRSQSNVNKNIIKNLNIENIILLSNKRAS